MNIHPCIACGYCQKADGCAFRDLDEFDRDLRACDLLLIATPVYNLSFPAQFKAVIDRFQRYFEARFARGIRPAIATHRDAVLLLTMGRYDPFAVEVCEKTLRQSFSVMNTTLKKTVVFAGHRPCRLAKTLRFSRRHRKLLLKSRASCDIIT